MVVSCVVMKKTMKIKRSERERERERGGGGGGSHDNSSFFHHFLKPTRLVAIEECPTLLFGCRGNTTDDLDANLYD